MDKMFYSIKEVRELVFSNAISITSLQNLVNKNVIPCERYGKRVFIPKFWVDEQIQKATDGKKLVIV